MRAYDFSPLFRSTVGFDRLSRLVDTALQQTDDVGYPPYNIEKLGDEAYRITMAVAGFGPQDIEIVSAENVLTIKGKADKEEPKGTFLHRGIAGRAFERRFNLADHIKVTGANLENGLLHVELAREVPEAMKPRRIEIAGSQPATIEQKAA
jgi:molecular chaperone IbpA